MKARPIKPAFWRDREVAQWSPELRLFYVGCWMLCDDQGVMQYDPSAIAADLYPYRVANARERRVRVLLDSLVAKKKLTVLPCGRHAIVPAVPEHPMGGRPTDQFQREHLHRCVRSGK